MVWAWWKTQGSKSLGWLSLLLICSGALNVLTVGALFYSHRPSRHAYAWRPVKESTQIDSLRSNLDVVYQFEQLSRYQLIQKLLSRSPIEDGFAERDLALSSLVELHYFDLERALPALPKERRLIEIPPGKVSRLTTITLYPGLSSEQWRSISDFAMTERWPLTPEGLFMEMGTCEGVIPSSLATAFFLSPQFRSVELLLARSESPISREEVLQLIREGEWPLLAHFTEEQRLSQDLSMEKRRDLLFTYLSGGSSMAACLLLRSDGAHLAHRSSDDEVIYLLERLGEPSAEGHAFALELLKRPRSSAVWEAAAALLERWTGRVEEEELEEPVVSTYRVEKGDSLWKVAHKHGCSIEQIVELNKLQSETIRPGQELTLP